MRGDHHLVQTMLAPEHYGHIREDVLEKMLQCETKHCAVSARNPRRASRTRNWRVHHTRRRGVLYHDTLKLGQLKDATGKKSIRKIPASESLATLRGPDDCVTTTVPGPPPKEPEGGMEDAEVDNAKVDNAEVDHAEVDNAKETTGDAEAMDAGDGERERATLRRMRARTGRRQSTDGELVGKKETTAVRPVELGDTEMHKTGMEDADVDNAGLITGDAEARDAGDGERKRAILQRRRARMSGTPAQEARRRSRVVAAPRKSTTQVVNVGGRLSRMDANKIEDHLGRGEMELDLMNIEERGPGPRPGASREELRRRSAVFMAGVKTVDEEGGPNTNWEPLEAVAELTPCASIKYILSDYNPETRRQDSPGGAGCVLLGR